jgi:hypothetical protein
MLGVALGLLPVLGGVYACGGKVIVDAESTASSSSSSSSGGLPDAMPPTPDASMIDGGQDDCPVPDACSRIQTHGGCAGPTTPGTFCDFFGTPCSPMPPDCTAIGALIGAPSKVASCGNGQFFCDVDWAGTLDDATFARVCEVRATFGVPLDCFMN